MTYVKICGLTNIEDALAAVDAGADYLGFIFHPKSPRCITPDDFTKIARDLPTAARKIGVFVNGFNADFDDLPFTYIQLHGEEDPVFVATVPRGYKALRPASLEQFELEYERYADSIHQSDPMQPHMLIDAYHPALHGGTGQQIDREIVQAAVRRIPRLMLAGGLTPDNVGEIIRDVKPFAVDVSSGVEAAPGKKDHGKIRAFVQAVREASSE